MVSDPSQLTLARKREIAGLWRIAYGLGVASFHSILRRLSMLDLRGEHFRFTSQVSISHSADQAGHQMFAGTIEVLARHPLLVRDCVPTVRPELEPIPMTLCGMRLDTSARWPALTLGGAKCMEVWLDTMSDPDVWDDLEERAIAEYRTRWRQ